MNRLSRTAIVGLLTGVAGLCASIIPLGLGFDLEESLGLRLLFSMRGTREAPPGVLIVAMNKTSAENLKLSKEPDEWPRTYHAQLVEKLSQEGARLIAFDIVFRKPGRPEEDAAFAASMAKAGNVILCSKIEKQLRPPPETGRLRRGKLSIETLVPPVDVLARSAVATAAFPLPKVPVQVSQYWTFKTGAGDAPTLPVMVFHVLALRHYEDLVRVMEGVNPARAALLPPVAAAGGGGAEISELVHTLREIFLEDPRLASRMLSRLPGGDAADTEALSSGLLRSMIRLYSKGRSRYLNFYGPPGTIQTISFDQALDSGGKEDVSGKVVFVGLSERQQPEQRDGFPTVYSQPDGTDLSGVEIAATAFANLVEDRPLRPLGWRARLLLLLAWGMTLGAITVLLPTLFASAAIMLLVVLYGIAALHQFQSAGAWYPMVSTLMVQPPFAMATSILWKSATTHRTIRRLVPGPGVDHTGGLSKVSRRIYGVCLFTDIRNFTSVSEKLDPTEITQLVNRYFDAVSVPVMKHRGTVYEYEGDSMMAGWDGSETDTFVRSRACAAALGIFAAAERFNQTSGEEPLHTRIGLHAGFVNRSSVGAREHLKYTIMGDTVNTASRLEGLNKQLSTWILASGEVLEGLDDFLTREVGEFCLAGKAKQVLVHELISRIEVAEESRVKLCTIFAEALAAYRRRAWEDAIARFKEAKAVFGEDGPSTYYIGRCCKLIEDPPGKDWSGLIYLEHK